MDKSGAKPPATMPPEPGTGRPEGAASAAPEAACLPCPPTEGKSAFPTRFARLFFGVITLLVLYYSYLIIKPYLLDIFMALVLFFTAKPLYTASTRLLRGRRPWPRPSPASFCSWSS